MPSTKKQNQEKNRVGASAGARGQSKIAYVFSVIILGLIIVTFIFTGTGQNGASGNRRVSFGSYAGRDINSDERFFHSQFLEFYRQSSQNGTDALSAEMDSLRMAFDNSVLRAAFINQGEKNGYATGEARLSKELMNQPEFRDAEGAYSVAAYRAYMKSHPSEYRSMEAGARDDVMVQRVAGAYDNAYRLSAPEKAFLESMGSWERSFRFAAFDFNDYPENKVSEYLAAHGDLFRSRNLSVFTAKTADDAEAARKAIQDGSHEFAAWAKEHSIDTKAVAGGTMGSTMQYALAFNLVDPAKAKDVMDLPAGSISEVLQVPEGYAFYKAEDALVTPDSSSPETLKQVRAYLVRYEAGTMQTFIEGLAAEFVQNAKTSGLDAAAAKAGKTLDVTSSFPINMDGLTIPTMYGDFPLLTRVTHSTDNSRLSDAQTRQEFFKTAFSLKEGEISGPVILSDKVLVMTLAKEDKAATAPLFAQFLPNLSTIWMNEDIKNFMIDKTLLVDRFNEAYRSYRSREN